MEHNQENTAIYASKNAQSRGRLVSEAPSAWRSEFQRDRDRIIHSAGFRKLRNKTQVFIESAGDYYRTRLTHSLEVAQIAKAIARTLKVNEDLAEGIALAHDLGHTCFGHAGEDGLNEVMQPYGGFNHNEQTFRILTQLEKRYIPFDGLNLCWEMLEGIVKHNGPVADDKLPETVRVFNQQFNLETSNYAGPEAQIAAIADDIAYNMHDMEDGYRAGLFGLDAMRDLPIIGKAIADTKKQYADAPEDRLVYEAVRRGIGVLVQDVLVVTRQNLVTLNPQSVTDIYHAKKQMVHFGTDVKGHEKVLRKFLRDTMYRHSNVKAENDEAKKIVIALFLHFMEKPDDLFDASPQGLPKDWAETLEQLTDDEKARARLIADYIAGMTDRYAIKEYKRIFQLTTVLG